MPWMRLSGFPRELKYPKLIGVKLTGKLTGFCDSERHHPRALRNSHGQGRHERHHRIFRRRRAQPFRNRQGDNREHGRGSADLLHVQLRRLHELPARHGPQGSRGRRGCNSRDLACDKEVEADPGKYFWTASPKSTPPRSSPATTGRSALTSPTKFPTWRNPSRGTTSPPT